jgi:hypothetical protein
MHDRSQVIEQIREGFAETEFPGEAFLQGSFDGCEPGEVIAPFRDYDDWRRVPARILDEGSDALSFFSEGAFRFFLPAYLVADVNGELATADPLFHLTHGFTDASVEMMAGGRVFERKLGGSVLLNPRRYGAITFHDYAGYRLSVFCREEASAIVAYLDYRLAQDPDGAQASDIEAALEGFWLARVAKAPLRKALVDHVAGEDAYVEALLSDREGQDDD